MPDLAHIPRAAGPVWLVLCLQAVDLLRQSGLVSGRGQPFAVQECREPEITRLEELVHRATEGRCELHRAPAAAEESESWELPQGAVPALLGFAGNLCGFAVWWLTSLCARCCRRTTDVVDPTEGEVDWAGRRRRRGGGILE